jgi:hypothetical protein
VCLIPSTMSVLTLLLVHAALVLALLQPASSKVVFYDFAIVMPKTTYVSRLSNTAALHHLQIRCAMVSCVLRAALSPLLLCR